MRRLMLTAMMVVAVLVAPVLAGEGGGDAEVVPLTDVVLFSSGVGYFGRSGVVQGDRDLTLQFKADQINDLLKSLVVLDMDGGRVLTVSYASHDPSGRALRAFGLDLTGNPTLGALLTQLRGIPVTVATAEGAESGTVLSVETRTRKTESGDIIRYQVVSLVTAAGIKAFAVDELRDIRIADKNLAADLAKALAVLAKSRDRQKKAVTISFSGKGRRRVSVAYVLEAPVWKTSYRLLLGDKPFLQGWAIVENTTQSDWSKVNLSLVSGRPISFIQDLYTPLYLKRPVVQPKLYAGLRPQEYQETLARRAPGAPRAALAAAPMKKSWGRKRDAEKSKRGYANDAPEAEARQAFGGIGGGELQRLARSTSVSAAAGGEAGELFKYAVKTPVSIARQSSAMLPIVAAEVSGEKVSIYNQSSNPKHPFNGFRLKNATSLSLLAGPVTVFDDGIYAGDSQIANLQPGEERLLSYGLDLACTVDRKGDSKPSQLVSAKIVNGVLYSQYKYIQQTSYTIKNKKDVKKIVLVEHPLQHGWTLITPKAPDEKTASLYRFRVELKKLETKKLDVRTERVTMQTYAMTNVNTHFIGVYIRSRVISKKVKAALETAVAMKRQLDELRNRRRTLESSKSTLYSEQSRIRSNMKSLNRNSKLYARYLTKLDAQETKIEKLIDSIETLRESERAKQKEVNDYLAKLTVK